jgi:hypothetical protein
MSDEQEKAKHGRAEKLEHRTKEDWTKVLATKEGRRVVYDILRCCGESSPFAPANQALTNYLQGKRDVGADIRLKIKKYKRGAIFQMEDEYNSDAELQQKEINEINNEVKI